MDKEYEKQHHQEENNNWWFKARRQIIFHILNKRYLDKNVSILDIGCSGGALLKNLASKGYKNILGIDVSQEAIDLCKGQGLKAELMDGSALSFNNNTFDVLIAADTLEHIKNEQGALKSWYNVLKPGGTLIIFVPAFMFLWNQHDEEVHHVKRYVRKDLIKSLKDNNFIIDRKAYWNFILFLPFAFIILLQKFLFKNSGRHRLYHINPIINKILFCILKLENFISRFFNFPFGLSILVIAKKK